MIYLLQPTFIGLSLFAKLLMMSKESWNLVPPLSATSAINWLTAIIICWDSIGVLFKRALIEKIYCHSYIKRLYKNMSFPQCKQHLLWLCCLISHGQTVPRGPSCFAERQIHRINKITIITQILMQKLVHWSPSYLTYYNPVGVHLPL